MTPTIGRITSWLRRRELPSLTVLAGFVVAAYAQYGSLVPEDYRDLASGVALVAGWIAARRQVTPVADPRTRPAGNTRS